MIVQNRFQEAFVKFVLFSAIIHVVVLLILALRSATATYLNYFYILQINLLFPGLTHGAMAQIVSILSAAIIYLVILLFFDGKAADK
ncbi:MAG: hypothetical protein ABH865_09475 [Candidatus Omnitrophota bacterium]|nr:hypothetical protein [Candidatus Omnitrophota bacterium]